MYRIAILLALTGTPADAVCSLDGVRRVCTAPGAALEAPSDADRKGHRDAGPGRWIRVEPDDRRLPADAAPSIGDMLPAGYYTLIGTAYRGLPPARDGWAYFDVAGEIYRVDLVSREILARVGRP